jgi:hypothetical protein
MKLRIFQSNKGDCLLLEAKSGELILCDGGMGPSMREYVRAELGALRDDGHELAFIYVSHIDNDHISGILQLLEDEVEWRVFDHHNAIGDPIREPRVPRPPKIGGILHNSFRDQIEVNSKPIENILAAMAPSLFATNVPELAKAAEAMQAIATGVPEAIQVSKLIAADALDIPLNKPPGVSGPSKLLFAGRPGETFSLGSMNFTLIGPTDEELKKLRDGWIHWLRNNKEKLRKIRSELKKRVDEFSTGALRESPFDLREWEGIPDHEGVSVPNIASLMFLVEENGKQLLLTGDGQQDFILSGLKRTGFLDQNEAMHLDVLKVQHHGSENNTDVDFARRISADHYVFCGNGEHENPDLRVIDIYFNSRLGPQSKRSLAPKARDRKFHFWFSTTSDAQESGTKKREHFRKVEGKVRELAADSDGLLELHFNQGSSITLQI